MVPVIKKKCSVCGEEFETKVARHHTCSPKCRDENLRRIRTKWMADKYRTDNPVVEKSCPTCGTIFTPKTHKQKSCSIKCRDRFYWNTSEGKLKKAEKDRRYKEGASGKTEAERDRLKETRRLQLNARSNLRYERQRREAGVSLAAEIGRCEDGTFPYVNGAARYRVVQHNKQRMTEQRRVWEKANGPLPEGLFVHHIDGCKKNNCIKNLQAMTPLQHNRLHTQLRKQQKIQEVANETLQ